MANPRKVRRTLAVIIAGFLGCVGLSLEVWDVTPVIVWAAFLASTAVVFAIVTAIYGLTVWPVLLLIGRALDRRSKPPAVTVAAEPPAAADRGQHAPGHDPNRSAGRGG